MHQTAEVSVLVPRRQRRFASPVNEAVSSARSATRKSGSGQKE